MVLVVVAVLGFVVVQVLRSDPIPSGDTTPQGEAPSPERQQTSSLFDDSAPVAEPKSAPDTERFDYEAELARLNAQIDAQIDAEAEALVEKLDHEAAAELEREELAWAADDESAELQIGRRDYAPKAEEPALFEPDADGSVALRLIELPDADRLVLVSTRTGQIINPRSTGIWRTGIHIVTARGGQEHHQPAFAAADLRPGSSVDLVREPQNPHDPNAIKLCEPGSTTPWAYVMRGKAKRLAKLLDGGTELVAVTMHGPGPGIGRSANPHVLVTTPALWEQITRPS